MNLLDSHYSKNFGNKTAKDGTFQSCGDQKRQFGILTEPMRITESTAREEHGMEFDKSASIV